MSAFAIFLFVAIFMFHVGHVISPPNCTYCRKPVEEYELEGGTLYHCRFCGKV